MNHTDPTAETDRTIRAPWTSEQVQALNAFQQQGGMHPFTCGALHASGQSPVLTATHAGWVCPDPQCVYRQDWAHAFMVERGQPAAASAVVSPPTSRADLRSAAVIRAAALLEGANAIALDRDVTRPGGGKGAYRRAMNRAAELLRRLAGETPPAAPTDRAAVLLEAANTLALVGPPTLASGPRAWTEAIETLRRLAAEAQQQPTDEDVVEAHRLALSEALHLGNGAPWDAILDRAGNLSRRDVEAQQQPDTEALTAQELAHAIDNATPYPVELHSDLCRFMAERLLEMTVVRKRPEHAVWQPDEEAPTGQPEPTDPESLPDRLRCPQCGEDITDYAEDDFVYRTDDVRPYCSGECVVAAHRAAVVAEEPAAADGEETR